MTLFLFSFLHDDEREIQICATAEKTLRECGYDVFNLFYKKNDHFPKNKEELMLLKEKIRVEYKKVCSCDGVAYVGNEKNIESEAVSLIHNYDLHIKVANVNYWIEIQKKMCDLILACDIDDVDFYFKIFGMSKRTTKRDIDYMLKTYARTLTAMVDIPPNLHNEIFHNNSLRVLCKYIKRCYKRGDWDTYGRWYPAFVPDVKRATSCLPMP